MALDGSKSGSIITRGLFLAAAPGGPNDKSAVLSHDHHPVPVQREFIDV